jgi:hypothetical protein
MSYSRRPYLKKNITLRKDDKIKEREYFELEKDINEFRKKYLDKFKKIYYELSSINESFPEKEDAGEKGKGFVGQSEDHR